MSAVLFFRLLLPLGPSRATAGAFALALTLVVYVAGLGAMDYLWGLTFFLAATLAMLSGRIWLSSVFLGLAAASRLTYALAIIPMALLYLGYDLRRLRKPVAWRHLAALALCSGLIALVFYLPAFLKIGLQPPNAYRGLAFVAYNGSVGLFGIIGFIGVACTVVLALINRRRGMELPGLRGRELDGWAITVIILYGLLFLQLPDESSYLLPALLGVYWLLCRYAPALMLWVLVAALLVSCFFLRLGRDPQGGAMVTMRGPVLQEIDIQEERRCVAAVVKRRLEASPDGLDYVIAGWYRPQLLVEVGAPLSERILYTVRPGSDDRLVDAEGVPFPDRARLMLLDRVTFEQSQVWPLPERRATLLDSYAYCAPRS